MKITSVSLIWAAASLFAMTACGHNHNGSFVDTTNTMELDRVDETEFEMEKRSPATTMDELLELETHEYYKPIDEDTKPTAREAAALRLANRVATMYESTDNTNADYVWMWAEATDRVLQQYAKENNMRYDTAVVDLHEALAYFGYDCHYQWSMNTNAYYLTIIQTYDVTIQYKRLVERITDAKLRGLVRAEYNAWFDWQFARCFTNTYYTHQDDSYSMLPLDLWAFHKHNTDNRLEALQIEKDVLTSGKVYRQRGKTVTSKQWSQWLDEQGYKEGMSPEYNMEDPTQTDFPALIKVKTERWLAARQAVAAYLGDKKEPGKSYDNLTADIHACIIGNLNPPIEMMF